MNSFRTRLHGEEANTRAMPDEQPQSDQSLYTRWLAGDVRAGDTLFRRFAAALRQFYRTKVRPEDVDDLVQQVWVELSETRRRGGVEPRTTVRAYVFGVARHVLCRHLRRRYRLETVDIALLSSSIAALDPSLSTALGDQMSAHRMVMALQRLPVDTQILIELRYINGLTTAELASLYDIPVGTVKSRLANARGALEAEVQRKVSDWSIES